MSVPQVENSFLFLSLSLQYTWGQRDPRKPWLTVFFLCEDYPHSKPRTWWLDSISDHNYLMLLQIFL